MTGNVRDASRARRNSILRKGAITVKIIAINASPRKNWNTAQLVRAAAEGAEKNSAEVEIIDLYTVGEYSGCISCFGCKTEKHYGECICNDDLKPVLDKIRAATVLSSAHLIILERLLRLSVRCMKGSSFSTLPTIRSITVQTTGRYPCCSL